MVNYYLGRILIPLNVRTNIFSCDQQIYHFSSLNLHLVLIRLHELRFLSLWLQPPVPSSRISRDTSARLRATKPIPPDEIRYINAITLDGESSDQI